MGLKVADRADSSPIGKKKSFVGGFVIFFKNTFYTT